MQLSLLNLRYVQCDEAEDDSDRHLNLRILNVEWLLWAGIGMALLTVVLVGIVFYVPEWAMWAWCVGLTLAAMSLMDLALWILVVAKSWRRGKHGAESRRDESDSITQSLLMFRRF